MFTLLAYHTLFQFLRPLSSISPQDPPPINSRTTQPGPSCSRKHLPTQARRSKQAEHSICMQVPAPNIYQFNQSPRSCPCPCTLSLSFPRKQAERSPFSFTNNPWLRGCAHMLWYGTYLVWIWTREGGKGGRDVSCRLLGRLASCFWHGWQRNMHASRLAHSRRLRGDGWEVRCSLL